jgi:hypothetical protein
MITIAVDICDVSSKVIAVGIAWLEKPIEHPRLLLSRLKTLTLSKLRKEVVALAIVHGRTQERATNAVVQRIYEKLHIKNFKKDFIQMVLPETSKNLKIRFPMDRIQKHWLIGVCKSALEKEITNARKLRTRRSSTPRDKLHLRAVPKAHRKRAPSPSSKNRGRKRIQPKQHK